jgi:hypothetical protein
MPIDAERCVSKIFDNVSFMFKNSLIVPLMIVSLIFLITTLSSSVYISAFWSYIGTLILLVAYEYAITKKDKEDNFFDNINPRTNMIPLEVDDEQPTNVSGMGENSKFKLNNKQSITLPKLKLGATDQQMNFGDD